MGSFVWPLNGYRAITSVYGMRIHPVTHKRSFHSGIDIRAGSGVPIYAARAGTVSQARMAGTYGNMVLIDHGGGVQTRYAHLSKFSVSAGQSVQAGQQIGWVGATGRVTGPHLHFEVVVNGRTVNPLSYVKPSDTVDQYTGAAVSHESGSIPSTAQTEQNVIHISQVEKIYTVYEDDTPYKNTDSYQFIWQSYDTGQVTDISDRVGSPQLEDDTDSLCLKLTFSVLQSSGERFMRPFRMELGDHVWVTNKASGETIFQGQIQTMGGSYRDRMSFTCLDAGWLLTSNEIIAQFNNVSAKEAIKAIADKVGITSVSCPELISSVYDLIKTDAAGAIQDILKTVTAENGVPYFVRIMGTTLVVRSYGNTCIRGWYKQEANLPAFDVLAEVSAPNGSWSLDGLRNHIVVYSESDNSFKVLAETVDTGSLKRYGRRMALETYSDKNWATAYGKARTVLASKNRIQEGLSLHCYGSDKIVGGCRIKLDLAEAQGEYWVTGVTHNLETPHTMDLKLRRAY